MAERVALVSGGNKGIGFAIVRALCKQLNNGVVYLTARNEERGKVAVARLNEEGLQPKFHQLDITDSASITTLRNYLKTTHGGLDILVNNAAIGFKPDATEPFGVKATLTIKTNFTALLEVNRALVPLIKSHGRIVSVAGIFGRLAFDGMSDEVRGRFQGVKTEQDVEKLMQEFVQLANNTDNIESHGWPEGTQFPGQLLEYGISKMGVIALTRIQAANLSNEKTREDVITTCCCPGYVATDMTSHKGIKTIDEGAETPVYCALLPSGSDAFNGKMFEDKKLYEFW